MWLLAVGCGLIVGKTLIHGLILSRFLRLKMFRANQVIIREKPQTLGLQSKAKEANDHGG